MRHIRPLLLVLVLCSSALAGCLSSMDETEKISLGLNYEYTNGTIVHSYVDGELESATHVVFPVVTPIGHNAVGNQKSLEKIV